MSAWADTSEPVVLRLEAKRLLEDGYALIPFSDPVWGIGECDWEHEICIEKKCEPIVRNPNWT
jgi:hypothetical protein